MKRRIDSEYPLKYPLELEQGTTIDRLVILRPTGADRLEIDNHLTPDGGLVNPMALQLKMIERLCRLPDLSDVFPGFARHLDDEDVDALGKLVMPDLPSGQTTGGMPSGS